MKLVVNGENKELENISTVRDVLESIGVQSRYIAVAINFNCIRRSEYDTFPITEGDEIEILTPHQGG